MADQQVAVRSTVWQDVVARRIAWLVTIMALAYALWVLTGQRSGEVPVVDIVLDYMVWPLTGVAATLKATRGRAYWPWGLIGLAAFSYGFGWITYALWTSHLSPAPAFSISDVLWLAAYPLAFGGIGMLMYSRVAHSGIDFWLDITLALLAAIAMFTMVFELSVGPIESADDPAWMTIMLIYLVFDVVMIVLGILVMQAFVWRPPAGLLLVFLAIIALTLTDWTYTMLVSSGSDTSARWIDLGWPLAAVLGTWAAATDTDQGSRRMEIGRVTTVIPGAAVLAALVVILVAGYRNLDEYIVVIAVVAILVATVRLIRAIAVASDAATQARLARTDHLTGLANRRMLYEAMDGALADAAVIVLDLDGFKVVNDTLGHEAGDEVLCIVSERFSHHVRRPDMLARLGGDEFAVLLSDSDEVSASQVAERLRDALRAPVVLRGREFQLSASIGIAAGHQDDDVLELMRHADAAMYEAKTTGRDLVRVYRS